MSVAYGTASRSVQHPVRSMMEEPLCLSRSDGILRTVNDGIAPRGPACHVHHQAYLFFLDCDNLLPQHTELEAAGRGGRTSEPSTAVAAESHCGPFCVQMTPWLRTVIGHGPK